MQVLNERRDVLVRCTSEEYVSQAAAGLQAWKDAGTNGTLRWGYYYFRKPKTAAAMLAQKANAQVCTAAVPVGM